MENYIEKIRELVLEGEDEEIVEMVPTRPWKQAYRLRRLCRTRSSRA